MKFLISIPEIYEIASAETRLAGYFAVAGWAFVSKIVNCENIAINFLSRFSYVPL